MHTCYIEGGEGGADVNKILPPPFHRAAKKKEKGADVSSSFSLTPSIHCPSAVAAAGTARGGEEEEETCRLFWLEGGGHSFKNAATVLHLANGKGKKIDLPKLVDALSLNAVASEGVKNLSEKYQRSGKIADLAQS